MGGEETSRDEAMIATRAPIDGSLSATSKILVDMHDQAYPSRRGRRLSEDRRALSLDDDLKLIKKYERFNRLRSDFASLQARIRGQTAG
jgi:hypothetical protein